MFWKKITKHQVAVFCRRLILVILGLLLGVNVYLANARTLTRNQLPMPFGIGMAVVLSGSMEPVLHVDDLIIVRKAEEFTVGDLVVYQSEQELIVHRIVSIDGETVITKGDANDTEDEPISTDEIQGKVVRRIPAMGKIVGILRSPIGILVILALAFALIELSFRKKKKADGVELDAIKEEIRKLKEQQETTSENKD